MNAAIEAAAQTDWDAFLKSAEAKLAVEVSRHYKTRFPTNAAFDVELMAMIDAYRTAAIIAFLRNCETTSGMISVAHDVELEGGNYTDLFTKMAAQLATELEGK